MGFARERRGEGGGVAAWGADGGAGGGRDGMEGVLSQLERGLAETRELDGEMPAGEREWLTERLQGAVPDAGGAQPTLATGSGSPMERSSVGFRSLPPLPAAQQTGPARQPNLASHRDASPVRQPLLARHRPAARPQTGTNNSLMAEPERDKNYLAERGRGITARHALMGGDADENGLTPARLGLGDAPTPRPPSTAQSRSIQGSASYAPRAGCAAATLMPQADARLVGGAWIRSTAEAFARFDPLPALVAPPPAPPPAVLQDRTVLFGPSRRPLRHTASEQHLRWSASYARPRVPSHLPASTTHDTSHVRTPMEAHRGGFGWEQGVGFEAERQNDGNPVVLPRSTSEQQKGPWPLRGSFSSPLLLQLAPISSPPTQPRTLPPMGLHPSPHSLLSPLSESYAVSGETSTPTAIDSRPSSPQPHLQTSTSAPDHDPDSNPPSTRRLSRSLGLLLNTCDLPVHPTSSPSTSDTDAAGPASSRSETGSRGSAGRGKRVAGADGEGWVGEGAEEAVTGLKKFKLAVGEGGE